MKRDIKEQIQTIEFFNSLTEDKYLSSKESSTSEDYKISKEEKIFIFTRKYDENDYKNFSDILISDFNLDNFVFEIEYKKQKIKIVQSYPFGTKKGEKTKFKVSVFETKTFQSQKHFQVFFRLELTLEIRKYFTPMYYTDINDNLITGNLIQFEINNINFYLYSYESYLIIENRHEIDFDSFKKYCIQIIACFGFITGYAPGSFSYFFSFSNLNYEKSDEFRYCSTFMHSYKNKNNCFGSFAINNNSRYIQISEDNFGSLCENAINNKFFANTIRYTLESDNATLEMQGVGYSVVFELFLRYFDTPENVIKSEKPLSDETAKLIKREFNKIIKDKICNENEKELLLKITNDINRPTNTEKLLKPFKYFNITIDDEDIKIISHRNNYLHANDFIQEDTLKDSVREYLYINLKMNFLINSLILKVAGFSGEIANLVKHHPVLNSKTENEPYFKKI